METELREIITNFLEIDFERVQDKIEELIIENYNLKKENKRLKENNDIRIIKLC